jgi:hypothetical protein
MVGADTGQGFIFSVTNSTVRYEIKLDVTTSGVSVDNLVFKPMIRRVEDTDPTWQPYAKTNKELTDDSANKTDLTNIEISGTTNNTGATISSGTFFYKDGNLVKAKSDIASGATLTLNTNYEAVTAGGLNALNSALTKHTFATGVAIPYDTDYIVPSDGYAKIILNDNAVGKYATMDVNGIWRMLSISSPATSIPDGTNTASSLFVRKGMTLRVKGSNASHLTATFYALN